MLKEKLERATKSLKWAFVGVGLISLPINLLMLTGPFFMLQVYDRVLSSGSVPTLMVLAGLAIALYGFYGLFEGLRSRVLLRLGQRLDAQISSENFGTAISLPTTLGSHAEKVDPIRDLDSVRQFLISPGPASICDVPWIPVYLGVIFLFDPILGIVATVGAAVICLLIGLNELVSRVPMSKANQASAQRAGLAEESRRNSEIVSALGMGSALTRHWEHRNDKFLRLQQVATDRSNLFGTLIKTMRLVLQSAMLGVGAWLVIQGSLTAGVMIAASIMTSRALAPIERAIGFWPNFIAARDGYNRLTKIAGLLPDTRDRTPLTKPKKSLVADSIFAGTESKIIIHGVSFELQAGDGLGVIGPTGAGKTTLARTLVGVYPIARGSLRLDGAELNQWTENRRGGFIGYLPQDIQLFSGSVAQNISRFDPEATAEDIIRAAEIADAHDLITGLADGYDTEIGVNGSGLSGGQMQRIALARAIYGSPFLVILDEPNSNLDASGDSALENAVRILREAGSIVVVIAHRPSALAGVNNVLLMKEGRTHAIGPKEEVLKNVLVPSPQKIRAV